MPPAGVNRRERTMTNPVNATDERGYSVASTRAERQAQDRAFGEDNRAGSESQNYTLDDLMLIADATGEPESAEIVGQPTSYTHGGQCIVVEPGDVVELRYDDGRKSRIVHIKI